MLEVMSKVEMRHLKKIRETDAGPIDLHWFHEFFQMSQINFHCAAYHLKTI